MDELLDADRPVRTAAVERPRAQDIVIITRAYPGFTPSNRTVCPRRCRRFRAAVRGRLSGVRGISALPVAVDASFCEQVAQSAAARHVLINISPFFLALSSEN